VITDVLSGGNPAVDRATNTNNASTTVDAAIKIVNTTNDKRSMDGNKQDKESCADASNDTRKATAANFTVPNTTGNGNIELANTTHMATMGKAFVATAASLTDAVVAENAMHTMIKLFLVQLSLYQMTNYSQLEYFDTHSTKKNSCFK
jgi:hypothetical protein